MKFIEVTDPDGEKMLINLFNVVGIRKTAIGPQNTIEIAFVNGNFAFATESYNDVLAALNAVKV